VQQSYTSFFAVSPYVGFCSQILYYKIFVVRRMPDVFPDVKAIADRLSAPVYRPFHGERNV